MWWSIPTKSGGIKPFKFTRAQRIINDNAESQMDRRGFIRQNVLKCRQVGGTTFWTRKALHTVITRPSITALTIAHEQQMPEQWLMKCRAHVEVDPEGKALQTPHELMPSLHGQRGNQILFRNHSRYYIGSVGGTFPAMGDTIQFLHLSEVGAWDKPPLSKDVNEILARMMPAVPGGDDIKGTCVVFESTGVMEQDFWHKKWLRGKGDDEYENVFLPWYLVGTYRRGDKAKDIINYSEHEKTMKTVALSAHNMAMSDAQIAWYRNELQKEPYFGNHARFAAEYPTTEDEAFQSPGMKVYDSHHVEIARQTVREPIYKMHLLGDGSPEQAQHDRAEAGEVFVWEEPDRNYHYVLGADCMWGNSTTADNDFAVGYIECLETGKLCAKYKGQWSMVKQAWYMAALGHWYNTCPVAPEVNAKAGNDGQGVLNTLLGNVSTWHYPNIWIRNDTTKFKRYGPKDWGWWTDRNSKTDLISNSLGMTLERKFDWCDYEAVDQMNIIIRDQQGRCEAPAGTHDDCWMARMITAEVARRERLHTQLYVKPDVIRYKPETPSERLTRIINDDEARIDAEEDDALELSMWD